MLRNPGKADAEDVFGSYSTARRFLSDPSCLLQDNPILLPAKDCIADDWTGQGQAPFEMSNPEKILSVFVMLCYDGVYEEHEVCFRVGSDWNHLPH